MRLRLGMLRWTTELQSLVCVEQMASRLGLMLLVLVLAVYGVSHADLVHSDPGLPIEDIPIIMGLMVFVSFKIFRPRRFRSYQALPSLLFLCLAVAAWALVQQQYNRASRVRVEGASVVFPGLYFPADSIHYTFTALVDSDRPNKEVENEVLNILQNRRVPVRQLRLHFSPAASPRGGANRGD
jgi:hypothetical protein